MRRRRPSRLRTRPNCSSSEDSEAATVAIVGRERGRVLPVAAWQDPKADLSSQSRMRLKRNALPTTLTEESAMAAAAMIGESRMPNVG